MEWIGTAQFWVIVAAMAFIAEIFTVSFFFMFLGVGAGITALLTWLGLTGGVGAQVFVFSVVSLVSMLFFRKYALATFGQANKVETYKEFVGDRATVTVEIPANGDGKIHYRGTEWIAVGHLGQSIAEGTHVEIKKMDGIKAMVVEVA